MCFVPMWNSLVSLPVQPPEGGLWMSASAFKTHCERVVEDWMVRVERAMDSSRTIAGQRTGSALLNIADMFGDTFCSAWHIG